VADLPLDLAPDLAARLTSALDREGKVARALEALGPLGERDVVAVGAGPIELRRLGESRARVRPIEKLPGDEATALPDASADAIVAAWSGFRGIDPEAIDEADRLLRPAGRLLVVHDYGRDDVSRLRGDLPEYGAWSRRDGPFLARGFRVRVLHCFWTWDELDEARTFLADAFGAAADGLAAGLKRPRLSWNVAVYHRTRGAGRVAVGAAASGSVSAPA
jgi:hypothetical protein